MQEIEGAGMKTGIMSRVLLGEGFNLLPLEKHVPLLAFLFYTITFKNKVLAETKRLDQKPSSTNKYKPEYSTHSIM